MRFAAARRASTAAGWLLGLLLILPAAGQATMVTYSDSGSYVALGDSFAAGEGAASNAFPYQPGTDHGAGRNCHRSRVGFAVKVAEAFSLPLSFHACSGAKASDYFVAQQAARRGTCGRTCAPSQPAIVRQRDWLTRRPAGTPTRLVTLMFGGNDVGFAQVAKTCATSTDCIKAIDAAADKLPLLTDLHQHLDADRRPLSTTAHPSLVELYQDVLLSLTGQQTTILVLGYPKLFPDRPPPACAIGPKLSIARPEMRALNGFVDRLNAAVKHAVDLVPPLQYVNLTDAFAGHDLCENSTRVGVHQRWVNRVHLTGGRRSSGVQESFHPNIAGQQRFADQVLKCLGLPAGSVPTPGTSIILRPQACDPTEPPASAALGFVSGDGRTRCSRLIFDGFNDNQPTSLVQCNNPTPGLCPGSATEGIEIFINPRNVVTECSTSVDGNDAAGVATVADLPTLQPGQTARLDSYTTCTAVGDAVGCHNDYDHGFLISKNNTSFQVFAPPPGPGNSVLDRGPGTPAGAP